MTLRRGFVFLVLALSSACADDPTSVPVVPVDPGPASTSPSLMTPAIQQELFGALDLSYEGLQPVAAAVTAGDYTKAQHELAEYYRHRTTPAWKVEPPKNPDAKDPIAEAAVEGTVEGGDIPPWHTFPDNKIDWNYNATYNTPGVAPNYGWQAMMSRMSFWTNLGNAYRATGDERYTKAWLDQFHSFIEECPPPDFSDKSKIKYVKLDDGMEIAQPLAYGLLETGIRMGDAWPNAFFSFLPSPQFTDEDVALYLNSILAQARYLAQFNTPVNNNRITMEGDGLYTCGVFFPEFKEAKDWRDHAVSFMHDAEVAQFLPDGAQDELSTMYHNTALDNFLAIADMAKKVERLKELPDDYIAPLEKGFEFDLYMMTPDRKFPEFNDSLTYHLAVQFKRALKFFPDRPDFLWGATEGKEGHPPTETSHAFPWAGYYVMRSGWEQDANYFVLRAGPLGESHAHQDKLNVILWPYGRELLYNGGGTTYEESKWRDYSTQSFSKNTVIVDGQGQVRDRKNNDANKSKAPIDARWESTPDHDFAAGIYNEGYGEVGHFLATHTRRVLFVKPDLFVVADTLVPLDGGQHKYEARWNLLTTHTTEDQTTHAITTTDENKPNMVILPLQVDNLNVQNISAQTDPEILGWVARRDNGSKPAPATTVVHVKTGSGTQSFLTLLIPLKSGAASPVGGLQSTGADSAQVTFNDGRKFDVNADPDPSGGIEVVETLADGSKGRDVKIGSHPASSASN